MRWQAAALHDVHGEWAPVFGLRGGGRDQEGTQGLGCERERPGRWL